MKESILFKSISYDTIYFKSGETLKNTYPLFTDAEYSHSSDNIQQLIEPELIKWLLSNNSFKSLLAMELGVNSIVNIQSGVIKPIFSNISEGEIDILIIYGINQYKSISIECKRINEKLNKNAELVFNRKDIGKISTQANRNRKLGFSKNYVCIIVEVNGSKTNEVNPFYRNMSDDTLTKVINFPGRDELHEDIGIIIIEVVQMLNKSYNSACAINLCVLKHAKEQEQPSTLTEKIISLSFR